MRSINTRGTFVVIRACIPHLKRSANAHILTLSPRVSLEPRWLGPHVGYAIAKYGMTLCALGFAAEFAADGIASNALWPRTLIATAAVQNLLGGDEAMARARRPELYSDAAYAVITKPSRDCTGNAFLCEDVIQKKASPTSTGTATSRVPGRSPTCSSTTPEASERLRERADPGDGAADDQRLHGLGALEGVDRLQVSQVPGDLAAEQDPVAAQHVPRVDGDRPRLAIARANITRADAAFTVTKSSGELSGKQQTAAPMTHERAQRKWAPAKTSAKRKPGTPGVTVLALVILFAVDAFIGAGLQLARAFSTRTAGPVFGYLLLALVLVLVVGIWAVIGGCLEIVAAFASGETAGTRALFILAGLVSIAFGVVIFARPHVGAVTLALLFGLFSLIYGVSQMTTGVEPDRADAGQGRDHAA
jgi:hypothetical protein